jgi:hypothetical protein
MAMDRRQFLRLTAAGAMTGLSVPLIGVSDTGAELRALRALAYPDLLAVLGAEHVRAIGVRYREATPAERDADALRAVIATSRKPVRTGGKPERLDPATLVALDFAEDRTVHVDGWVLSITEARQCALFSLLDR